MSTRPVLRLGTRGSVLAQAQSTLVARALRAHGIDHEIVVLETAGDRRAADTAWGEGAFVTAIERALLDDRVDAAVHSAKDVPTDEDPRLAIAAFLPREEPRDALVLPAGQSGSLATLPGGATIGTDSPRRTGFLRAYRPDLDIRPLHGNVDTRLRRLDGGDVDGLLLAAAGLIRLGLQDRISELVPADVLPPAPAQGAIAVQVRVGDGATLKAVGGIDDVTTRHAVEAERAFLRQTGGGCRAPIGALATINGASLVLLGGYAALDGSTTGFESLGGPVSDRFAIAKALAERLVADRARMPGAPRVLVTRPAGEATKLAARLTAYGIAAVIVPTIEIAPEKDSAHLREILAEVANFDWVVVTSANAARAVTDAARALGLEIDKVRWAAVGHMTARELLAAGATDAWMPPEANAVALGREIPLRAGDRVMWPHGELAQDDLEAALVARGASVTSVVVYRTIVGPGSSRDKLVNALGDTPLDGIIFASPSAVEGLFALTGDNHRSAILATPAVCVGARTAEAARQAGFAVVAVAASQDNQALAELASEVINGRQVSSVKTGALA